MRNTVAFNDKWAFSKEADQVPERMPERWIWVDLPHTCLLYTSDAADEL